MRQFNQKNSPNRGVMNVIKNRRSWPIFYTSQHFIIEFNIYYTQKIYPYVEFSLYKKKKFQSNSKFESLSHIAAGANAWQFSSLYNSVLLYFLSSAVSLLNTCFQKKKIIFVKKNSRAVSVYLELHLIRIILTSYDINHSKRKDMDPSRHTPILHHTVWSLTIVIFNKFGFDFDIYPFQCVEYFSISYIFFSLIFRAGGGGAMVLLFE